VSGVADTHSSAPIVPGTIGVQDEAEMACSSARQTRSVDRRYGETPSMHLELSGIADLRGSAPIVPGTIGARCGAALGPTSVKATQEQTAV